MMPAVGRVPTVLFCSDDSALRTSLAAYLGQVEDLRLMRAISSPELERSLIRLQPDILVVDLGPDGVLPDVWGRLPKTLIPATIFLGVPSAEGYRTALRVGARDLIGRDGPLPDLAEAIYRVGLTSPVAPQAAAEGQIVTLFGLRGGVGKTYLAVNLALAAAARLPRGSVALVDANLHLGAIDHVLSVRARRPITDLPAEAERLDTETLRTFLTPYATGGVDVLTAPDVPEAAEYLTPQHFERFLDVSRQAYQLTVIDTSSSLSEVDFALASHADAVLLLVTPDLLAVRAAQLALSLFDRLDVDRAKVRLVLTAWSDMGLRPQDVAQTLGVPVWEIVPYDRAQALRTLNEGRPTILGAAGTPVGRAADRLAARLVGGTQVKGRRR